jgi:hypothetical protein
MNALTATRDLPSPTGNFPEFVTKLSVLPPKQNRPNPEEIVSLLLSSTQIEDANFLIWRFSDCLSIPFLFINSLKIFLNLRTPVCGRISQFPGSLDFFFDRHFPLLEPFPLEKDPQAAIVRINLFKVLCKLLIDYPDKILRFSDFHRLMWNSLLRLMKNSSSAVAIAHLELQLCFSKLKYIELIFKHRQLGC